MNRLTLVGLAVVASFAAVPALAADLSGKWTADGKYVFTFDRAGDKFTGAVTGDDGKAYRIVDGAIDGDAISFFVLHESDRDAEVKENGGKAFRNTAKGTVSGDEMSLSGSREGTDIHAYSVTLHRMKNQ
ncbi:MAG TPA: hypothetical protein VKA19_05750 [Alphaproteobacteria bacterium]|nr:hypothetical protein [Alphaproteobacteria bacterium]